MPARMKSPAYIYPEAMRAMIALGKSTEASGLPEKLFTMIHLRGSQINGCAFCTDMHSRELKRAGEPDERIWAVGAWHDSTLFNEAERAVLALTEHATRMNDRNDPVPDHVWNEAARHYDEKQLGAIVLQIAAINAWNRINVTIRQPQMKPRD